MSLALALWILDSALFLVGSGSHSQGAEQGVRRYAAEVALLDCDGTPCVEAIVDEKRVRLGIDTGNVDSVLDFRISARPGGANPGSSHDKVSRMKLSSVRIGSVTLTNLPALEMDLKEMIQQKQMPRVDGTLAYTAFKDRMIELDFAANKLRISDVLEGTAPCRKPCDRISLIKFGNDGPPIVVAGGFEINGKPISAQVDTMYTGSLLVYTAAIERLELSGEAGTKETEMFPLTDGGVAMKVAAAKSESFRGLSMGGTHPKVYFPTQGVHEPDGLFDATVGLALFRHAVVSLDFHNMTIRVQRSSGV